MAILKLKKKFHTNTVSIANIGQSWAIKPRVSAIVVKHREKPSHPGILESVPFLTSLGYHTACCPAPGEQINYSSYVPSKETFFCKKGRKLLLQCRSLLRVNESQPQCKRGISIPISSKCGVSRCTQLKQMLPTVSWRSRQDAR